MINGLPLISRNFEVRSSNEEKELLGINFPRSCDHAIGSPTPHPQFSIGPGNLSSELSIRHIYSVSQSN